MIRTLIGSIASLILCCFAQGQVSLMPFPTQQFFDLNGKPCAGCLLYTYASGTSVPLATFTDYTGTVQNTNPIVLNGSGYPANGNTLVGVWLSPGVAYRVRLTLANNSQVYQLDGIMGPSPSFLVSAGAQSTITVPFSVTPTFTAAGQVQLFRITLTANVSNSSLVMTGIAAPSIVNFEITQDGVGGHTFVWPVNVLGAGTISAAANQTSLQQFLWDGTNAVATSGLQYGTGFNAGFWGSASANPAQSGVIRLAGTDQVCWRNAANTGDVCEQKTTADQVYLPLTVPNAGTTGTFLNDPVKLTGAPSTAVVTTTADTGGAVGICVAGCGTTGNAIIQQYGVVGCQFDGTATVAGDYVQLSSSATGNCRDVGAAYPNSGQVLGRVLSTNAAAGTYNVILFGPEMNSPGIAKTVCTSAGPVSVNPPATATVAVETCQLSGLNQVGKTFRVTYNSSANPAASYTLALGVGMGNTATLGTYVNAVTSTATALSTVANVVFTCAVQASGVGGLIVCSPVVSSGGGGTLTNNFSSSAFAVNLTSPTFVGSSCSFGTTNASNSCSTNQFTVEQLN